MAEGDGAARPGGLTRVGVIAAVALVLLGAAAATPWVVTLHLPTFGMIELPDPGLPPMTFPPEEPMGEAPEPSPNVGRAITIALVALAIAVASLLLFRLLRRLRAAWRPDDARAAAGEARPGEVLGAVEVDIASLATAVARADAHLSNAATPRDAVTAAWVALEDEAELQGASRDPAQTATEFTVVLLERTPAPADAVASLRALYHRARFTAHDITADDVRDARAALTRIAGALDAAPEETRQPGEEAQ
jgi:hypothetical protein